jgi:hypothetical protein
LIKREKWRIDGWWIVVGCRSLMKGEAGAAGERQDQVMDIRLFRSNTPNQDFIGGCFCRTWQQRIK